MTEPPAPDSRDLTTEDLDVSPCRPSEIADALALQNMVFGINRDQNDWNWRNKTNPYVQDLTVLGRDGTTIITSYAMVGTNLNFFGQRVTAVQSTDTVVHPELRRRGLFLKTAHEAFRLAAEQGIRMVIGFPNEQAMPINIHKLRVAPLAYLRAYRKNLGLPPKFRRKLGVLAGFFNWLVIQKTSCSLFQQWWPLRVQVPLNTKLTTQETVPEQFEALWDRIKGQNILSFWKDSEYLRWRYDQHPRTKGRYFCLTCDGVLVGMCVTFVKGNVANIAELFVMDRNVLAAELLVNYVCDYFNSKSAKQPEAVAFAGSTPGGLFESTFASFDPNPNKDLIFCGICLTPDPILECTISNTISWTLTGGDSDALY